MAERELRFPADRGARVESELPRDPIRPWKRWAGERVGRRRI